MGCYRGEVRTVEGAWNGHGAAQLLGTVDCAVTSSIGEHLFGGGAHRLEILVSISQRHHDRGEAAHRVDGATINHGRFQRPGQLPAGRRIGHADQERAVTKGPHLPIGNGACHAPVGATTSIPAPSMARRTAAAIATAPGESLWMHSVSTHSVSTLPSTAATAPRARLRA